MELKVTEPENKRGVDLSTRIDIRNRVNKPYHRIITYKRNDVDDSYFVGEVLEFEGCMCTAPTAEECYDNLSNAMEEWIATKIENGFGRTIPEPISFEQLQLLKKVAVQFDKTIF